MTDPASTQPDPAAPAAQQHTTVIHGDQPVLQVTFAQPDNGRWFRVLNSLIDSGAWGRLSGQARSVLVVLARHASQDGTSLPALSTLIVQSGLSKSGVHNGLKELAAGDRPLIRRVATGRAWELFPGRPFARRGLPGRGAPPPPPAPSGRPFMSTGVDHDHAPPPTPPTPVHRASTPVDAASTPVDLLLRRDKRDVVVDTSMFEDGGDDDDGGGVFSRKQLERLERIGVRRHDVAELVRRHGRKLLLDSLANTEFKRDRKEIKTTARQYFFNAVKNGYPLFAEIERDRQRTATAKVLAARLGPLLSAEQVELVRRTFRDWTVAAKLLGITTAEHAQRIEEAELPGLARWLVEQAVKAVGAPA